jgi:osmoprotectant transport system permease protein
MALLEVAANRLLPGDPIGASAFHDRSIGFVSVLSLAGVVVGAMLPRRAGGLLALCLFLSAWAVLLLGLGAEAARIAATMPPAARASLGSGFWIASSCLLALAGGSIARVRHRGLGALAILAAAGVLVAAWRGGGLDGLSLAVEYAGRREAVHEAIAEHLLLAGGALALAIPAAVLLSLWRSGQGLVGLLVSGVQVIPAVALLGALVALVGGVLRAVPALRDLGLSALGPWPALLGIAAYLLLPLWRGIGTALRAADPAAIDAAEAMGLTKAQILTQVKLPLGAPMLVGALRVAAVQSLGLATLGALIGAGGLGRIVFDGMAQFAPDLILLGAIPIILLSLAAEGSLSAVEASCRARWRA